MGQALFPDAASWAEENFGGVDLGLDSRRDRLVYSAARLAASPGASLPAVFRANDLRCFYSLLHRKEATHQALLAGHTARTKQAMTTPDVILVIHDTTELDFTSHKALHPHLGPVGTGRGRGLLQHNSLAVRAKDGLLLGLAHQQLLARRPRPQGETRAAPPPRPRVGPVGRRLPRHRPGAAGGLLGRRLRPRRRPVRGAGRVGAPRPPRPDPRLPGPLRRRRAPRPAPAGLPDAAGARPGGASRGRGGGEVERGAAGAAGQGQAGGLPGVGRATQAVAQTPRRGGGGVGHPRLGGKPAGGGGGAGVGAAEHAAGADGAGTAAAARLVRLALAGRGGPPPGGEDRLRRGEGALPGRRRAAGGPGDPVGGGGPGGAAAPGGAGLPAGGGVGGGDAFGDRLGAAGVGHAGGGVDGGAVRPRRGAAGRLPGPQVRRRAGLEDAVAGPAEVARPARRGAPGRATPPRPSAGGADRIDRHRRPAISPMSASAASQIAFRLYRVQALT